MAWTLEWDARALRDAKRLSVDVRKRIVRYLRERIEQDEDPRRFGKPLTGDKVGLWRYRVDNYRIICSIEDDVCKVLVISVGHRKSVYW